MTPKNIAILVAGACVVAVAFFYKSRDSGRAADVTAVVREAVAANSELNRRFGTFLRLSGDGYERPPGVVLIERIEVERVAEFERMPVGVYITVFDPNSGWEKDWHIGAWTLVTGRAPYRYALNVSMRPGAMDNAPLQLADETDEEPARR